ncbi:hypothetical protein ACH4PW_10660 [Streptomyces sp. NPDC017082]|uniref:hypothetical protein n=1 Tax=Streptomyces sp. NPDC017082 TaxID=3364974 RepID=UPI00378D2049
MTSARTTAVLVLPVDFVPHILLPRLELLCDARTRGAECVWGGEVLTTDTAIDLNERVTESGAHWFPRACRRCLRSAVRAARGRHPADCPDCTDFTNLCPIRRALHDLLLELGR